MVRPGGARRRQKTTKPAEPEERARLDLVGRNLAAGPKNLPSVGYDFLRDPTLDYSSPPILVHQQPSHKERKKKFLKQRRRFLNLLSEVLVARVRPSSRESNLSIRERIFACALSFLHFYWSRAVLIQCYWASLSIYEPEECCRLRSHIWMDLYKSRHEVTC
jgi:hypothetical protein